ncbi:MAG: LptF/LptG family permease [Bacteroidaceae bacterium]|nr:LptF/LptG family permease [Bacteroidaceae bacterium]
MRLIKKLDIFILKKFLQLFAGSFFVCLFIFMMQFTWRYVDDLIGKGLTLDVLAQFFWYMSLTLTPTSLPLAVLLASLITFGNMSESLELLSIKAAGVSLLRAMAPLIVFCSLITAVSFLFQNRIAPEAQKKLTSLIISMRQNNPAVEIPEGVFYGGVPNVNLYVQRKAQDNSGMLYQVIIYKTDQGFEQAQIVLADSARLEMSKDKQHLTLDLWAGEMFENLQGGYNAAAIANEPYDRETFQYKRIIIDFDANFNMVDADMLRGAASTKSMAVINHDLDSIRTSLDSMGRKHYSETVERLLPLATDKKEDGRRKTKADFDTFVSHLEAAQLQTSQAAAGNSIRQMHMEFQWRKDVSKDTLYYMRLHQREWHQKITLSLACLLFFFIGAPLGAVIGKGGLGTSAVISVIIFILYYIVNTSGMKMGRQGTIPMWMGMWASTAIMLPCGAWITYQSNRDKINININFSQIWKKIKALFRWPPYRKPLKTSDRDGWSLWSMMKTAKTKATSLWPPRWPRKRQ